MAPTRIRSSKGLAVDLGVAESTGLEPATSAVTGQRSNQLSYDSNPRKAKLELITMAFNQNNSSGPAFCLSGGKTITEDGIASVP
jgi:hypothetical protein